MNRGIYATATGMIAAQQWMDVVANNLANASTTGFKRDSIAFDEAMLRELASGVGKIGSGPIAPPPVTVFEPGAVEITGNPLDLAIGTARGLFAVQTADGIRYTRDGSFSMNEKRELVKPSGAPIRDIQHRKIVVPQGTNGYPREGNLTVNHEELTSNGVFDSAGFQKEGANLYTANAPVTRIAAKVRAGALEGSNVNAIESMVQMISITRSYELAQKSIQSQDEQTQKIIQSLSDR